MRGASSMNEIKNYTMNFGYGRSQSKLNLLRKLASAEIHCVASSAALLSAQESAQ